GTVRRLVPAVRLQGALDAAGTLTGRLADAQFSGTLRHRPRDLPPSVIRGVVRLDSRSDTLAVFADVVADSLSFDGLRGSFPGGGLPLAGAGRGPGRARGARARPAAPAGRRFADRRVYVDSLRLSQPGLITTGSGVLGWARPARGTLSLDLDADSLNSVDSLIAWVAGRALGREGGGGGRSLAGAARVAVTLEGALDSLAVEARASLERLRWREWEVPAGRARVTYRPGPVPAIA